MVRKVSKKKKKALLKKKRGVSKKKKRASTTSRSSLKKSSPKKASLKKKKVLKKVVKKKRLKKKVLKKKATSKKTAPKKPAQKRVGSPKKDAKKKIARKTTEKKTATTAPTPKRTHKKRKTAAPKKKVVKKKKAVAKKIVKKKRVAKKVSRKKTPQRQAVQKKVVSAMSKKRSTKMEKKAEAPKDRTVKAKSSPKASVKKAVKKAVAKVSAPKTTIKKAILSVKESKLAKQVAKIKRPLPRMRAKSKTSKRVTEETLRLTHPSDIENIISQLSDAADEIRHAESTKFHIGVEHNAGAMPEQELPSEYGKDRAVILVVDPRFVFTYWEVRSDSLAEAARHVGDDGKLTLRFYDVSNATTPEQSHFWDIEVFDRLGNWYLKLEYPEQLLCLDIGIKNNQGHFYRITRSNFVKLPQQSLAKPGPIKWMVVTPSGEKSISDVEEYTDADLVLLKKILGPYFFDLLMRGRLSTIAGSSIEGVFYDVNQLSEGPGPGALPSSVSSVTSWTTAR